MDSAASHHVTVDLGNMSFHSECTGPDEVLIGDGKGLSITHIGLTSLQTPSQPFQLSNVLYVPHIKKNLISAAKFC